MNIIIPLGGTGERFKTHDYKTPKVLIPVLGKEIIFWILDSLKVSENDCITIIYNNELGNHRFEDRIKRRFNDYKFSFIKLPFQTRGPVETVLYGLRKLSKEILDRQLVIHDGDSFIKDNISLKNISDGENKIFYTIDTGEKPLFSYLELNKENIVVDIMEKIKISDNANIGCYVFENANTFIKYGEPLLTNNNEVYISHVYKKMIEDGLVVNSHKIEKNDFVCFGTPQQLVNFATTQSAHPKRFCFDLDNTLVTFPKVAGDYTTVEPIEKNIKFLQHLKLNGHYVIIYTARRMATHSGNVSKVIKDIGKITFDTLEKFNIPYDEICFGKPNADFYIDDLSVNAADNLEKETGFYINSVEPRTFNNITESENTIIKTSVGNMDGEIFFYKNCPSNLTKYIPKLIKSGENYLEIEKIHGNNLSKMYANKNLTTKHIDLLFETLNEIHSTTFKNEEISIYSNYTTKLRNRMEQFDYSIFKNSKSVYETLMYKLLEYERNNLGEKSIIHGDFVLSNIFITNDSNIKFIDMRGKAEDTLSILGDKFYDYAKLYQSLIGYDFILNNSTPSFAYIRNNVSHFESIFKKRFGEEMFDYLKYITASLLFTLIPLHKNVNCLDYYNLIDFLI